MLATDTSRCVTKRRVTHTSCIVESRFNIHRNPTMAAHHARARSRNDLAGGMVVALAMSSGGIGEADMSQGNNQM